MVYMLASFAEIRFRGDYVRLDSENAKIEATPVNEVGYLIINVPDERIYVQSAPQPRIEFKSLSGDLLDKLDYNMVGDTLTIAKLRVADDDRFTLTIYVPKEGFRGIESHESWLRLEDLRQSSLTLEQSGGRVRIDNNVSIDSLTIIATSDADITGVDLSVDVMKLDLNNSSLTMRSSVNRLEGTMTNGSVLNMTSPNDIEFSKDNSSRIFWSN